MFVKHCPDPELSCIFKCKPFQECSPRQIQMRIDDHQRELRASGSASGAVKLKGHNTALINLQCNSATYGTPLLEQCHIQYPPLTSAPDHSPVYHTQCSSPVTVMGQSHASFQTPCSPLCLCVPVVAQNTQSEERTLTPMETMM